MFCIVFVYIFAPRKKTMNTKLKNISTILSGIYQKEVPDGNLLYLQVKDFTAFHLSKGELSPSLLNDARMSKHLLQDEDLLFASKGTSNFCAIYKKEMGDAVASTSFFVLRLTDKNILAEYLCWYINTPQVLKTLQAQAVGSFIPSISKEALMELDINVPDMERQRTIIQCAKLQEQAFSLEKQIIEKKKQLYLQLLFNATK